MTAAIELNLGPAASETVTRAEVLHDAARIVDRIGGGMDRTGCVDGVIETYSGVMFPVLQPAAEHVRLLDIAHALANVCRYGGHCYAFYSVAQHSVHVADCLRDAGYSQAIQLAGLLHDGSEAYLADICRPVKPYLTNYAELEAALQAAIWERFGLSLVGKLAYPSIKWADNAVLRAEAQAIMPSRGVNWNWGDVKAADIDIEPWHPRTAERLFLKRYGELADLNAALAIDG